MVDQVQIEDASQYDLAWIKNLLISNDLCHEDLPSEQIMLKKILYNDLPAGVFGLEIYGTDAILRSVAIEAPYRNLKLGSAIMEHLDPLAKQLGLTSLFLLTTSADAFFLKFGFKPFDRNEVPETIKRSEEFSNFCPDSAICMNKTIS